MISHHGEPRWNWPSIIIQKFHYHCLVHVRQPGKPMSSIAVIRTGGGDPPPQPPPILTVKLGVLDRQP